MLKDKPPNTGGQDPLLKVILKAGHEHLTPDREVLTNHFNETVNHVASLRGIPARVVDAMTVVEFSEKSGAASTILFSGDEGEMRVLTGYLQSAGVDAKISVTRVGGQETHSNARLLGNKLRLITSIPEEKKYHTL